MLLLSRDYPVEGRVAGGIGVYTRELALALAGLGEQVLVATLGEGRPRLVWEDGIPVVIAVPDDPLRVAGVFLLRGALDDLFLSRRLVAAARRVLPSGAEVVVDAPNWGAQSLFATLGLRRWPAVVRVATDRRTLRVTNRERLTLRTAFETWLEGVAVRRASRLVAFDPSHIQVIRRRYRWRRPVAVIPLGLAATPAQARRACSYPYILAVGRIEPRKGVDTLLQAFRLLAPSYPELRLILAGNAPREPGTGERYLDRWLRDLPPEMARRVVHLEGVPDGDLRSLYAGAAAYVTPASAESFGLTVSEAMREGVPVVASDIPAFRGRVINGLTGYRIPVGDAPALAAAVRRLLDDPAERERMGAAAREHFLRTGTAELMARRSQALYDGLTAPRRLGPLRFRKLVAPESRSWALDLGSGPRCLAAGWKGWQALAVDRSLSSCAAAHAAGALAVCADASRLPFRDRRIARVFALELLEHVRDPALVLAECRRVLFPGGAIAVSVPTSWSERLLHLLRPRNYLAGAGHLHIFSQRRARRLIVDADLIPYAVHRAHGTWTLFWIVMALAGATPTETGDAVGAPRVRRALLWWARQFDRRWIRLWALPLLDRLLGKSLVLYAAPHDTDAEGASR